MPIRFNALLRDRDINPADVRLLRHQDTRGAKGASIYQLWREDRPRFEAYQAWQPSSQKGRPKAKYWAVFLKDYANATLFVGLYEVRAIDSAPSMTINPLSGQPVPEEGDVFVLEQSDLLAEFAGRLCVDWGPATRARAQRADRQDKLVIELRKNIEEPPFPGHLMFVSNLSSIETLPRAWRVALSQARGAYLLTCPRTKEQYIGSASGEDGFIGRWFEYLRTGHGGNKALKSREPSDYQVSILELAGSSASVGDILDMERRWKAKLQSVEMGLNRNR